MNDRVLDSSSMRIPADALIPAEKLTRYLLLPRPWGDKAKFLAQAGFERANAEALLGALRALAASADSIEDGENDYGQFLRTEAVTAIWLRLHLDGQVRFVTLKPRREKPR
jgi:hypothetical protein